MTDPIDKRVLLAVFAHPDDESFGPGGTLAKYSAEGADVWLVCATDGIAGTVEASLLEGYANPGQLRAAELCCAAQTLGLSGVDWLGYRDSGMAGSPDNEHPDSLHQAPLEQVTDRIVTSIRRHRPQAIICDNEFGGYGHPDHLKLHQATMLAFDAAADPAYRPDLGPAHAATWLYHPAFGMGFFKLLVRLMPLLGRDPHKFGRNADIDLLHVLTFELPAHVHINTARYLDVKMAASACHHSQGGPGDMFRGVPRFIVRRWLGREGFTQARPLPQPGAAPGRDLFEGSR